MNGNKMSCRIYSRVMNALIKDITKVSRSVNKLFMVFNRVLTDINNKR